VQGFESLQGHFVSGLFRNLVARLIRAQYITVKLAKPAKAISLGYGIAVYLSGAGNDEKIRA
jgi:hypothetical protein